MNEPKYHKGQRIMVTTTNNNNRWNEGTIAGVVNGQYGNFVRYVVTFKNGRQDVYYQDDIIKASAMR